MRGDGVELYDHSHSHRTVLSRPAVRAGQHRVMVSERKKQRTQIKRERERERGREREGWRQTGRLGGRRRGKKRCVQGLAIIKRVPGCFGSPSPCHAGRRLGLAPKI